MAAYTYTFESHEKGDTFLGVRFTLTLADGVTPIDISNSAIALTTNRDIARTTLSTENGKIAIIDGPGGIFEVSEQVIDWEVYSYTYRIKVTFPNGRKRTYIKGTWQIV